MKKTMMNAVLALALATGVAVAQAPEGQTAPAAGDHGRGHGMDPQMQLQHLTKALNLTADQQTQILPILTDHLQQVTALRNDDSLAQQDRRDKMKAIRENMRTKVNAILTPDQQKKFQEMADRQRAHRDEHSSQ